MGVPPNDKLPEKVNIKRYGVLDISDPLGTKKLTLFHNTEPKDELFSLLEYHSEIDSVGNDWLKSKYPNSAKRKSVYRTFRSFIRQAKSYYYAAEGQDYNIAPLSYFYAFENLFRAYLTIKQGDTDKQQRYHGLHYKPQGEGKVYAKKNGVFNDFYYETMRSKIPENTYLNIEKLLNYCSDISYEYKLIYKRTPAYIRGKSAFVVSNEKGLAHLILAINPPLVLIDNKALEKSLKKFFKEANLNNVQKLNILEIPHLREVRNYSYHISKEGWNYDNEPGFLLNVSTEVEKAFPQGLFPSMSMKGEQFTVFSSLRTNRKISCNEIIAIYVTMFYLSNIVRYYPEVLESSDDQEKIWLLKRFVQSAPLTMLKYMVYLLLDKQVVLERI
jgi:hypothetical protein